MAHDSNAFPTNICIAFKPNQVLSSRVIIRNLKVADENLEGDMI
jgi:hypothetical protein